MQFHRLDKAKDKSFWSVRVSSDIRLIVHKTSDSLLLCYVDHHDKAYAWAERRKLETHPDDRAPRSSSRSARRVQEIVVPVYVQTQPARRPPPKPPLFADDLRRRAARLRRPGRVAGRRPAGHRGHAARPGGPPARRGRGGAAGAGDRRHSRAQSGRLPAPRHDPFEHPDAQRRFRVVTNVEELERALEYPWEKWTVFLHPAQREMVERDYGGPARVSGSAGTGKTIVALHRAVYLARANPMRGCC